MWFVQLCVLFRLLVLIRFLLRHLHVDSGAANVTQRSVYNILLT